MEVQPTATGSASPIQGKIDENREARESERKASEDAEVERQEAERSADSRASTEEGVGEQVDIEA